MTKVHALRCVELLAHFLVEPAGSLTRVWLGFFTGVYFGSELHGLLIHDTHQVGSLRSNLNITTIVFTFVLIQERIVEDFTDVGNITDDGEVRLAVVNDINVTGILECE